MNYIVRSKSTDKSPIERIFCLVVRLILVAGVIFCESSGRKIFMAAAFLFTFSVRFFKLAFRNKGFWEALSGRTETLLCIAAFASCQCSNHDCN